MAKADLTAQRLRELLHYDPETGVFTRIAKASSNANRRPLGPVAGNPSSNLYLRVGVDGTRYLYHRLAWLYMTGEWPAADVDHINRDRQDNRWANLRAATRSENMQNLGLDKRSKSGVKGVSWNAHTQKWHARFKADKRMIHLGFFRTIEEAAKVYAENVGKFHTHLPQQPQQTPAQGTPTGANP